MPLPTTDAVEILKRRYLKTPDDHRRLFDVQTDADIALRVAGTRWKRSEGQDHCEVISVLLDGDAGTARLDEIRDAVALIGLRVKIELVPDEG